MSVKAVQNQKSGFSLDVFILKIKSNAGFNQHQFGLNTAKIVSYITPAKILLLLYFLDACI